MRQRPACQRSLPPGVQRPQRYLALTKIVDRLPEHTQATPDREWIPWFHISNSGCCAFSVGAPVTAWVQSVNPVSS